MKGRGDAFREGVASVSPASSGAGGDRDDDDNEKMEEAPTHGALHHDDGCNYVVFQLVRCRQFSVYRPLSVINIARVSICRRRRRAIVPFSFRLLLADQAAPYA